jgi:hypothetical protein
MISEILSSVALIGFDSDFVLSLSLSPRYILMILFASDPDSQMD